MKEYKIPHSMNKNFISGKEVSAIPALASSVGALVGVAAAGVALEGGKAVGRKIFGDDRFISYSKNSSNLKVIIAD